MNFEEIEKEFNELMKHGQELIEKLKKGQETESDFDVYEINFNGNIERIYFSKEEMTFEKAQEIIKKAGKKPLTVSDLWQKDEKGVERWRHLKEVGCKKWVWCQEYSDNAAYLVDLYYGGVATFTRTYNGTALCF